MSTVLLVSWGTSKGRDTYGYRICRLDDTDTQKRYRCMGGGYDMVGTVFGEWLQATHQDELRAIKDQAHMRWTETDGDSPWESERNDGGLYGMSHYTHSGQVVLDGACGIESMRRIAEAIGLKVSSLVKKGRTVGFTVDRTR